jgi:hypothetical protein
MAEYLQFVLPKSLPKHSGRGVRFEILDPTARDQMLLAAATLAGDDDKKLAIIRQREGVRRMLRAVTRDGNLTEEQILALPETAWTKVDAQMLALDDTYKKLFTTKDDELLCWLYRDYHEITKSDVEAIAGKVRTVSTD